MTKSYSKKVLILILVLSLLRSIVACTFDLGNDESYYWLYSQVLKWNYFDHPPIVAIWIRIFTLNLLLEKYLLFLRLGSIFSCALATWFMYKCVAEISSEKAGWFAACFYNASFYAGITAGLYIFPDSPQMVFYTFSLWMIARITKESSWKNWILFGLGSGLCIMCKVHGVFLWIGLGLHILFFKRIWLRSIQLYVSLIIALLITSPILIWNIHYDFLTLNFESNRIFIKGFPIDFKSLAEEFFGEFFINNPFNVSFIILSLIAWFKYKLARVAALSIFNFTGLIPVFILLSISLYRTTLPHWSGPAYISLIPIAAIRLAQISPKRFYPKFVQLSLGTYIAFIILCPFIINYYPGNFGSKKSYDLGKGDLSLDLYGWKEAGKKFDSLYKNETLKGIMPANSPVICNQWWGAHIEYYFCRPMKIKMIGLGGINQLHEYMWMNDIRKNQVNMANAYCIINSDDYYDVRAQYKDYYSNIDTVAVVKLMRGKKPSSNFYVFRLRGWKSNIPVAQ